MLRQTVIVIGRYRWFPKAVAFRNDYCRNCGNETIAFAERTFDALHVFWIPLLPLGFWTNWFCCTCSRLAHAPTTGVRRPVRILLTIFLLLLSLSGWLILLSQDTDPAEITFLLGYAGVTTVGFLLAFFWAWRYTPDNFRQALANVKPFSELDCPLCGAILLRSIEGQSCQQCGAEYRPLASNRDELIVP